MNDTLYLASSLRASYGVSFVSYKKINDPDISRTRCEHRVADFLSWKIPHNSPLRMSYGVSFVSYTTKNGRDISRAYCTEHGVALVHQCHRAFRISFGWFNIPRIKCFHEVSSSCTCLLEIHTDKAKCPRRVEDATQYTWPVLAFWEKYSFRT